MSRNLREKMGEFNVKQFSPEQRGLVSSLAKRLGATGGFRADVLGGAHARGRAQPGSDMDLGLLYSEAAPISIETVCEQAEAVNDTAGPRGGFCKEKIQDFRPNQTGASPERGGQTLTMSGQA